MTAHSKPYLLFLTDEEVAESDFFLTVIQMTKSALEAQNPRTKNRLIKSLDEGLSLWEKVAFLADDFQQISQGFQHQYTRNLFLRALADATILYFDAHPGKVPSSTTIEELLNWYERVTQPPVQTSHFINQRERLMQHTLGGQ